jgi:hypothetical protein
MVCKISNIFTHISYTNTPRCIHEIQCGKERKDHDIGGKCQECYRKLSISQTTQEHTELRVGKMPAPGVCDARFSPFHPSLNF